LSDQNEFFWEFSSLQGLLCTTFENFYKNQIWPSCILAK
jgi:hypothetical protein